MKSNFSIITILFLGTILINACGERCIEKREYVIDYYPSEKFENFIPYQLNNHFLMLHSNGDTLKYVCRKRSNTKYEEGLYAPTSYEETKHHCTFDKYVKIPFYKSYDLQTKLQCTNFDSLSIDIELKYFFNIKFKNQGAYYFDNNFDPSTRCQNYSCLSTYSVQNKVYSNVLALPTNQDPDNYGYNIDSLYYNKDFGILKVKFTNGNTIERL